MSINPIKPALNQISNNSTQQETILLRESYGERYLNT